MKKMSKNKNREKQQQLPHPQAFLLRGSFLLFFLHEILDERVVDKHEGGEKIVFFKRERERGSNLPLESHSIHMRLPVELHHMHRLRRQCKLYHIWLIHSYMNQELSLEVFIHFSLFLSRYLLPVSGSLSWPLI